MKKTKNKEVAFEQAYKPPPDKYYWFYIGYKYYRRIQPVPYSCKKINIESLKKNLQIK